MRYLHHRQVKTDDNDLAKYIISKTQPKMSTVTGAAIRNCIFHVLKEQATFSSGKRNASHISRSLFGADLLKKLDEGYNCCFVTVRLETEKHVRCA